MKEIALEHRAALPADRARRTRTSQSRGPTLTIGGLLTGLFAGALVRAEADLTAVAMVLATLKVVGTIWMNALRMTVIPLTFALIIGAIAGGQSGNAVGRLGATTLGSFFASLILCSVAGAIFAPLLLSGAHIDADGMALLHPAAAVLPAATADQGVGAWLTNLFPTNPFKAAAEGAILPLVVFASSFGLAALASPERNRHAIVRASHTVSDVMLVLVRAVLALAPLGVLALGVTIGAEFGIAIFATLGNFIAIVGGFTIAAIIVLIGLTLAAGRMSLRQFFAGAGPAMLLALGTSSSLAALPAMVDGGRTAWKVREDILGFVLPLAVSMFKMTTAFSWVLEVYFLSVLFHMPLTEAQLALAAVYAVAFNATVPAIPAGGVIAVGPLFLAFGLPTEGLAILLAVNPITDRLFTVGNVVADMTVLAVVARLTHWFSPASASLNTDTTST